MNKAELVAKMAEKSELTKKEAEAALNAFMKSVEEALNLTNQKFINRFEFMEESASKVHKKIEDLTLEQMEELWQQAKEK